MRLEHAHGVGFMGKTQKHEEVNKLGGCSGPAMTPSRGDLGLLEMVASAGAAPAYCTLVVPDSGSLDSA